MFNNLNSTLKKVLVVFLIITLTYANLILIGSNIVNGLISYAVEEPEEGVSTENEESEEDLAGEETDKIDNEEVEAEAEALLLNIENKDIHKTTISENGEFEYTENLVFDLTGLKEETNITVEDILREFYNNDETLNEDINLGYKTTVINKENLTKILGENGKIVLKDIETDKVLVELTNDVLASQELDKKVEQKFIIVVTNEETGEETSEEEIRSNVTVTEETIEIEYVVNVAKLKIELTNIITEQTETESQEQIEVQDENEIEVEKVELTIENTKTISNINDLENLSHLQQSVKYVVNEDIENARTIDTTIAFKDTTTRADFTVDNTKWVVGEANTVKYTITLDTSSEKSELFVNPMFLLEMPSSVESINTAKSQFTVNNDNGAFTGKRVFVTTVMGRKFVVITLEGEQTIETIKDGNTTIDLTLELNITENTAEGNETTKLYYRNDTVTVYDEDDTRKSFDTKEITVSMIMESKPKDEISEKDISVQYTMKDIDVIKQGEEFSYHIYVYNGSTLEEKNIQIENIIPEGSTIVGVTEIVNEIEKTATYTYNEETRTMNIGIDFVEGKEEEVLEYYEEENSAVVQISKGKREYKVTLINNLEEGVFSKEFHNVIKLIQNDEIVDEENFSYMVSDVFLNIEQENLPETINENEQINLGVKITNKGLIETAVNIDVNIPEEIKPQLYKTALISPDGETLSKTEITVNKNILEIKGKTIGSNETLQITIIGNVTELDGDKEIAIEANINEQEISWKSDVIDKNNSGEEPGENPGEEPGQNPGENPGEEPGQNPGENPGEEPGQNPGEEPGQNPGENPSEEPEDKPDENPEDEKTEGFDLSLKQYLNKVTVTNSKGTTIYNYTDTDFAKVEIHRKLMNESKITFEYKIVVKNEGTIPGYARKIVNYMPEGLEYNQELNKDWYLADDQNIYSVALIEKLLNPGETAEITIILEKQMSNENTGTVSNVVEIYEATNDEGVEDINSIPGDRLEGQNDISKVDVLIVTSTGTIILYTTLVITIISIIGLGFYKVRKITLNKKGGC